MGGSDPNSDGGAANAVCLTSQPVLKEVGGEGQFMGGAEYGSNSFGPTANNDVPCAVCRGLLDRSVLMIPGTDVCTPGCMESSIPWTFSCRTRNPQIGNSVYLRRS